jgi:FtsZ-interacting cell division protein ZipA
MRVFVMAVVGLMVAGVAQAQQSTQAQQNAQAQQRAQKALEDMQVAMIARECPGVLRAQHQPTGPTMWTVALEDKGRDAQAQKVKGPGLHVEFEAPKDGVKTLELTVSYLPAGLRVTPVEADMQSKTAKESKKTFVLQQEAARRVDADLLIGPAATITRVHLVRATFADGNVWNASSEDVCSVAPSLYMPVEAKK